MSDEICKTTKEIEAEASKKIKKYLTDNLVWSHGGITPDCKGGQSCGIINTEETLYSEELSIKITIGYHRSWSKNRELALTLFELAMDDLIK